MLMSDRKKRADVMVGCFECYAEYGLNNTNIKLTIKMY